MDHIDRLTRLAGQVERITHELETTRAARDNAIRAAYANGRNITVISRAANLSRQAVYNVLANAHG